MPGSMHVDITCFWRSLHPIPQSCLLPALPSRVKGVGRVMPSIAAVSWSHRHSAQSEREEKVEQPSKRASDWHPSLPWNSQPRGSSGLAVGKGVSRDEGEPAQENHLSFLGHFTLSLTGPPSVLTLTLS